MSLCGMKLGVLVCPDEQKNFLPKWKISHQKWKSCSTPRASLVRAVFQTYFFAEEKHVMYSYRLVPKWKIFHQTLESCSTPPRQSCTWCVLALFFCLRVTRNVPPTLLLHAQCSTYLYTPNLHNHERSEWSYRQVLHCTFAELIVQVGTTLYTCRVNRTGRCYTVHLQS